MYCVYQTDKNLEEKLFLLKCTKDEFIQNVTSAVGEETYKAKVLNGIRPDDIRIHSCFSDGHYLLLNGNQYHLVVKHKKTRPGIFTDSVWFVTEILFMWKILPLEIVNKPINKVKIDRFELKHMYNYSACILKGTDDLGSRIITCDLVDDLGLDENNLIIISKEEENKMFYGMRYPGANIYYEYNLDQVLTCLKPNSCLVLELDNMPDCVKLKELIVKREDYQLSIILVLNNIVTFENFDYVYVLEGNNNSQLQLIRNEYQILIDKYGCIVLDSKNTNEDIFGKIYYCDIGKSK